MKKNLLLSLCLLGTFLSGFAQVTLDNFEDSRQLYYSFTNGVFVPYFGNPDPVTNTSPVVAKYTRNAAELFDVLVLDAPDVFEDLSDYLSNTKQMSIDVWSPAAGITVQITLEDTVTAKPANFPTGRHSVYLTTTTVDSAWETLTFSFDNRPDATVSNTTVNRLVLLFNPNTNTAADYYFDNLVGPALSPDPCEGVAKADSILNDYECNQSAFVTFNHGASLRRIPNPDASGANTSSFVGRYTRNSGEEFDVIVGQFPQPLAMGDTNGFRLMVWTPTPTVVRLALQKDGQEVAAVSDSTSTASQWEELEFRFGDLSDSTINSFVILFAPGTFSFLTYYMDNFSYVTNAELVGIEDYLTGGTLNVYPNPTQGQTQFEYELQQSGQVSLEVLDITGKKVASVYKGLQTAGPQRLDWDATDLPNGLYLYRFSMNGQFSTGKMILSR